MRSATGTPRAAAWLLLLFAAGATLHLMGTRDLAAPPLGSLGALVTWAEDGGAATSAVALLRIGVELTVWYLLASSLLQLAAARSRSRGVGRIADAVALPGSRRLVHAGLGVGLLTATAAGTDPEPAPESTAWMQPRTELTEEPADTVEPTVPSADDAGTASMTPRPAPSPSAPDDADEPPHEPTNTAPTTGAPDDTAPDNTAPDDTAHHPRDASAPTIPDVLAGSTTWRVDRGESFWSIAADVLADAWGRPVTDVEIDPFWRALVAHNRDRLVDPGDPDVIMAGQVFELPTPPPAPEAPGVPRLVPSR